MRKMEILTAAAIRNCKPDRGKIVKRLLDGAGLYLQATRSETGVNRNWIFRYELDGERHDYGIGPLHTVSLAEARSRAGDLRLMLIDGIDPLRERKQAKKERLAAKAKEMKVKTFQQCTEDYFKVHGPKLKNEKYRRQWLRNMTEYVFPVIGNLNVADIDTPHIEQTLAPIWNTIGDTASKIQAQIKRVFDFAIAGKYRTGDNPARRELIGSRLGQPRRDKNNHAALKYDDAPAFMVELRKDKRLEARALELCILTCARTEEIMGAKWSEFDLGKNLWTVPGERMKKGREHRVPLSDRALEILHGLKHRGPKLFEISPAAMRKVLQQRRSDATVHGMRSTFRDWAAERTNYPEFIIEMALAHRIDDKTVAAYKRTDLFDRRVRLMKQWGDFLAKPRPAKTGDVADLKAERERRANA